MITAESFPTPHLALRTNDLAEHARVGRFAVEQARQAEELRAHLAATGWVAGTWQERVAALEAAQTGLAQWRHRLATQTGQRLGVGLPGDAERHLTSIADGGASFDRIGPTGRLRDGSVWDPATRTYRGGEETPASLIVDHYGRAAQARFEAEDPSADRLQNYVRLPHRQGTIVAGNSLVRRAAAAEVAQALIARTIARGRDTSRMETGGDPMYVVTAAPEDGDVLRGAGLVQLALAPDAPVLSRSRLWQDARYLLYQGPLTKRGSDACIRVLLVAVGAVLFRRVPVIEQDADLRCMVLRQGAATEHPADADFLLL